MAQQNPSGRGRQQGGGAAAGSKPPASPRVQKAQPSLEDRLEAIGKEADAKKRSDALAALAAEVAKSGDINPLLEALGDKRTEVKIAAIAVITDPDIAPLYSGKPEWRGAVAAEVSAVIEKGDMEVIALASTVLLELLHQGFIDADSQEVIKGDVVKAQARATLAQAIIFSFLLDYLP